MKISDWLFKTMVELGKVGVDSPRRDALSLLEDTLKKDRTWVLAHHDYDLTENELNTVDSLISQRINREPLAYIRGKAWFYGRFFEVNESVLIPRPESEQIIELANDLEFESAIDIGTGSGVLAIALALENHGKNIAATDISVKALAVAKKNSKKHHVKINFIQSDIFEKVELANVDLVLANLPYVPDSLVTSPEILTEPNEALFAGKDGLDLYERFWKELLINPGPKYIITESLESQHDGLKELAKRSGYRLKKTLLLAQLFERVNS